MSGSKSKIKGNSFERDIAQFLTKLYGESFVRAAHSGAYIGGKNQIRKEVLSEGQIKSFKGDIIPPDGWQYFNAELKSYKDFAFHALFSGSQKVLDQWLEQCYEVANENDLSFLIMKFDRIGKYICVPAELGWTTSNYFVYASKQHDRVYHICELTEFFEKHSDAFKKRCHSVSV